MKHRHRCGYGPQVDLGLIGLGPTVYQGKGCGRVTEHEVPQVDTDEAYELAHTCICGVVTTWRYFGPFKHGDGEHRLFKPAQGELMWPRGG